MATGTVQFQSATLATPIAGLSVMADAVNDTDHGAGTAQYIKIMDGATGGTLKAGVSALGLVVVGTFQSHGTAQSLGTFQQFGTAQMLGSVQGVGTFQVLGSVQPVGTAQSLGTVQTHGTSQIIGTTQPLAGSVHLASNLPGGSINAQGVIAHGAVIAGNPQLWGAFGSSGTQTAVGDGQLTRLWADLNGRLQVRGTIDSIPNVTVTSVGGTVQVLGSVQTVGTSQVLGSVQGVGTFQVLGSVQPLAGSVHVANTAAVLGSVSAQGYVAHDVAAAGNPLLFGAFGSSGTQSAVSDGDVVRLWSDLNGRLQVRGTIDSIPAVVITSGTVGLAGGTQHIGSVQRLTGGTLDFIGGTVAIGTVRQLLGTINGGTVTALAGGFGSYFGTAFTANTTLGTLIAPPASGTRWRLFDLTISAGAAGTALLQEAATAADGTVVWGPLFFAANGGMVLASARGLPARVTAQGLFCSVSVGTIAVTINYGLET